MQQSRRAEMSYAGRRVGQNGAADLWSSPRRWPASVLELVTAATEHGEVGLIERAPSGDTPLIAVMDDEHHVGRLAVVALAALTRPRECALARCLPRSLP